MHRMNSWFARFVGRSHQKLKTPTAKPRRLVVEYLEPRRLLSLPPELAALLAAATPNPQVSGDQPQNPAQLIPLSTFSANPLVDPGIASIESFFTAMDAIDAGIAANPAARPAVWGENVAGGDNEVRLHFDDNGMNILQYTVTWGDGSANQTVPGAMLSDWSANPDAPPWVVHQYPAAGQYTITVSAYSVDGTYSASSTSWYADLVGVGGGGSGLQASLPAEPPTLHVAAAQTVADGATFTLDNLVSFSDADASSDVAGGITTDYSYAVDWGDGSAPFSGSNVVAVNAGGSGQPFVGALSSNTPDGPLTHVYADPGTYNLAVTVTENSSGLSDTQIIPVTVVQLVPTISMTVNGGPCTNNTCNEGDSLGLSATVAESASLTDPVTYAWQISDSEGNIVAQGTDPTLNYTFTYADTYTVLLVESVDNVQSAPVTATITVNLVAPTLSWVSGTTPTITASVGQTVTIPPLSFTDPNPNDTHTVTVNWDSVYDTIPLDTGATVTEETTDGTTIVPGTITDSYTYATTTAASYTVEVTLTDSEGVSAAPLTFYVNVVSAAVTLTDFAPSSDGSQLDVSYTVTGTAGPFNIDIYTSPNGSTPDQLLQTVAINGSTDLPLTTGTASFTPQFDDIQSNYHLIAVAAANGATSGIEFDGGIFVAASVTASPPQDILYVFGSNSGDIPSGGDTVNIYGDSDSPNPNSVVFDDGTAFPITSAITGIHVRGEAGNDVFDAAPDVTLPLWLFGGEGNSTLTGGAGNNIIVGGSGTNVIHDGNGQSSPQVVDSSETLAAFPGLANYYQETGTWTDDPTPGTAYNGGQRLHAAGAGDTATWTFANLDPTTYYDIYVTWSPEADASTTADFSVIDGGGPMDPIGQSGVAPVNQTEAAYDVQAAGVSWQDLGVFQAGSGMLNVQLAADASSPVLANAVMILPYETVPLTNLTIGNFTVDSQGNLSVSYTINGEDSPPFNIGIYGSPDGRQATNLLQTYSITDPTLLGGGGQSYTVTFPAALDSFSSSQYVIAELDSSDAVEETTKADNISAPLSGIFEQGDGTLVVLGNAGSLTTDNISLTQDPVTCNVTVNTADSEGDPLTSNTFSGVTSVIVSTPGGNNTVNVDPSVTVPVAGYAGPGSSVAGTVAATDATPTITIVDFDPTIDKGGFATLTANVGNLGGLGFTVTVDWGYYEGSDTIIYPAGTTSFSMTHHYVDDGTALFAIDFPVTIDVVSANGETASAATSTMGQDVLPAINIAGGTGSILAGTAEDLSAVVADPGEFGTFTYEWTATGGGDSFSSTSAIFDFTPTNNADHTVSLDVIDPDGKTVNEILTIPGYVWPSGAGSITPFVPDEPSVTIEECDADGTPDTSPVQAGSDAYFQISVDGTDMPQEGTVTVYYNTENGPSIDGSQVACANTDYIATGGQLTFTYATSYVPQVISVQTKVTSNGGTFSVQIPGIFDSDADIPDNVAASVNCTIDQGISIQMVSPQKVPNILTAKPVTVVVGQQISLTAITPAGATLTNEYWTIQGSQSVGGAQPLAIAAYSQLVSAASFTSLPKAITGSTVQFYWTMGGPSGSPAQYTIAFDVTINGVARDVSQIIDVVSPAITFSSVAGKTVGVGPITVNGQKLTALHYGVDEQGKYGMQWNVAGLRVPASNLNGIVEVVQLLNVYSAAAMVVGTKVMSTYGSAVLDDVAGAASPGIRGKTLDANTIAENTNAANPQTGYAGDPLYDSPFVQLGSVKGFLQTTTKLNEYQTFSDYLMYKPATAGSVWVTVQAMSWTWGGGANKAGFVLNTSAVGTWQSVPALALPSANQVGKASNYLPQWSSTATSLNANVGYTPATQIGGNVTVNGTAAANVSVTATWANGKTVSTTTAGDGLYALIADFGSGPVTVTCMKITQTVTPNNADVGNVNFTITR